MAKNTFSATHLTSISQLCHELNWKDFKVKMENGQYLTANNFSLIAIGNPDSQNEKWIMDVKDEKYNNTCDLIYALVVEGKLLKLGKSITTMKERISSYHCGKNAYRQKKNATNSATNWFILQSVIAMGKPVYVYAFFTERSYGEFMGEKFQNRISKEIEAIILARFAEQYGFRPLGNRQR